jgi:hypothetical protein
MSEVEEFGQGTWPWATGDADAYDARDAGEHPGHLDQIHPSGPEFPDDMPEPGRDPEVIGEQKEDAEHTTDSGAKNWPIWESSQRGQPGLASDRQGVLEQRFGPQQGYHEESSRRMNVLATVLRSEDADVADRL